MTQMKQSQDKTQMKWAQDVLIPQASMTRVREYDSQDEKQPQEVPIPPVPVAPVREDDHLIKFEDTRKFAAEKWRTAVDAQAISPADWQKGKEIDSYEEYGRWIRQSATESKDAQQKSSLQSLLLVARPVYGFVDAFKQLSAPEEVDMSVIWSLLYINISQALPQNEKLKCVTTLLVSLKRSFEALNQCIDNCSDKNSARAQATDVFDPLLSLLTGLLKFQRTYVAESVFVRTFHQMRESVFQGIEEIDRVIYHYRQIAQNTREQQDLNSKRFAMRGFQSREKHDPYDKAAFPIDNLPDIRTEHFFGREVSIERIDSYLGCQDVEKLRTYLIYGLRGVGKTQVALEYAHRYSTKFDAVFWIRCETSASLRQSFSDISIKLELSTPDQATRFEENQLKVLEWLAKTQRTWLLIYDNAEREQALDAYWPRDAVGSVLLTSRSYYNFEHQERRLGETIPVFSEEERWDLLMELLGSEWRRKHLGGQNGERERNAADKLLSQLGGLALAISQAAKLVLETRITNDQSIVTLLKKYEDASKKLPPRFSGHRNEKIHALDTIFSIALDHVSKNARSLLGIFSLLAPDSIPVDLFLPANQKRLDGSLEFAKHDGEYKAALELSSAMRDAVKELKAAGLIRQDDRTFIVHRVIQEAMNFRDLQELQSLFDSATELLHEAFPIQQLGRPLIPDWPECQMYIQHVVHLTKAFANYQKGKKGVITATTNFIRLLSNAGWYLYEIADYAECLDMMNVACSATNDKESLLYSHLANTLGAAYYDQNKLKKARICFAEARQLRERHLERNHPQIATIIGNAGNVESAEGNLDEAQELFEQAARIRETHGDKEIISLGLCLLQLGRIAYLRNEDVYIAIKRYDKAEACFLRKPALSKYSMAHLHYARGNLELSRRDFAQATAQYEKCRDVCYEFFPVHPLQAAVFYKLAVCEIARGRRHHDRALLFLEKAYNIACVRSYGEVDGAIARIKWKRAEIMIDDPVQRSEGLKIRDALKFEQSVIARELGVQMRPEWSEEESFDMIVPGYFR